MPPKGTPPRPYSSTYRPSVVRDCAACGTPTRKTAKYVRALNYCSRSCASAGPPVAIVPDPEIEGAVRLPLRTRDGTATERYALIDAADAELVGQWRWHFYHGYAARAETINGKIKRTFLHRVVLGLTHGDGTEVDHIDRDRLNTQRSNLRLVPHAGNLQNFPKQRRSKSRFRGVHWHEANRKWIASVTVNRKHTYLGSFLDEDEAGAVAKAARLRVMPYAVD